MVATKSKSVPADGPPSDWVRHPLAQKRWTDPHYCGTSSRFLIRYRTRQLVSRLFQPLSWQSAGSSPRPPRDRFRPVRQPELLHPMSSPTTTTSDPASRSRTLLFISYRDSQARASRYSRSRRTRYGHIDDGDGDDDEAQRLIRSADDPRAEAAALDVGPQWCASRTLTSCLSHPRAGWTSQTRSKQPSSIPETRVRGPPILSGCDPIDSRQPLNSDTLTRFQLRPLIPD